MDDLEAIINNQKTAMSDNEHLDLEVRRIEGDVLPVARAAESYAIVDAETMEGGVNFLGKVKEAYDRVERTRVFFTKPLLDIKKTYDARFKPILDELEKAEKTLKTKMTDYRLTLPENAPTASTTKTADAKVTFIKKWKHRVVDAAKVPDAFWKIDDDKIAEQVRSGLRNLPGVEIFEVEEVRAGYAG